jgi:hypothetical protein
MRYPVLYYDLILHEYACPRATTLGPRPLVDYSASTTGARQAMLCQSTAETCVLDHSSPFLETNAVLGIINATVARNSSGAPSPCQ